MNNLAGRLLLGLTLISAHNAIQGGTIVSTFGPGDWYDPCCSIGDVWPTQLGYAFQAPTGSNFAFTGAALALSKGIGSVNAVDIYLRGDASGEPGAILESFHLVDALGPAGNNNPPVVVTSVLNPVLLAGGVYWLIESPSNAENGVNWQTAYIPSNHPFRADGGDAFGFWEVFDVSFRGNYNGAFAIFADPVSSNVPEPNTLLLLASGLGIASLLTRVGRPAAHLRRH